MDQRKEFKMEKEKRVEYRLEYSPTGEPLDWDAKYFDDLTSAYNYITEKRLFNFTLVKEELIAQRRDNG